MKTNNKNNGDLFDLNDAFPETEMFLEFVDDDSEIDPEEVLARVRKVTEQYSFAEILEENDMSDEEALGLLYELGYIGLPTIIEAEDDDDEDDDDEEI